MCANKQAASTERHEHASDGGVPNASRPADWTEIVPQLARQPDDVIVTKHRWGAFFGTSLDAELRKRGVTQIFLAGISTTRGVESTARSAYELGYRHSRAEQHQRP
jgi:nicotinamidase-related amidase